MTSDIIDRIDALVDEQLAAGEPEGGYESHAAAADPDPDYPRCPHCRRHWHGLRMTERIAYMYRRGQMDPDYDATTDDSRVVCEGSEFIGPRWIPEQFRQQVADEEAERERRESCTVVVAPAVRRDLSLQIIIDISGFNEAFRRAQERMQQFFAQIEQQAQQFTLMGMGPMWEISGPGTFTMRSWFGDTPANECPQSDIVVTFGPQNWIHEIRRIPPSLQFPRSLPGFRLVSPLQAVVRHHWREFTAVEDHTPRRPGYDFSQYDTPPATGPEDDRWPAAPRVHRAPPATARRRKARARG